MTLYSIPDMCKRFLFYNMSRPVMELVMGTDCPFLDESKFFGARI
jgi:hypothetical protein